MERFGNYTSSISRQDWSLHRKGERDEARHNDKVKESIKGRLEDIVSDGSIITADPKSKKTIKIPLKSLELPRFKYGKRDKGVGSGDGSEQPGDVIGKKPGPGNGEGEAGEEAGEEYYEAELTIEEIQELVFEELGLPLMKPKQTKEIETDTVNFNDVRKKRTMNNMDLARTVLQNMMRNAAESGKAEINNISPEDYRVRTWEHERKPENSAVVIAMADISGSMGDFEKYATRAFCWWTVNFLRSKYPKVDIVFIAHDTEAQEVTEEQFFSRGTGGGTKCSSANKMAIDIINDRYPPDSYNVYPLHFSDGENIGSDNATCVDMVQNMLNSDISQYAFVQVLKPGRSKRSQLYDSYQKEITDKRFKGIIINSKDDVLPALKQVFNPNEGRS